MPFTFKLSKRLARIRRQGSVAPAGGACHRPCPPVSNATTLYAPTTHHATCRVVSSEATGAEHQ